MKQGTEKLMMLVALHAKVDFARYSNVPMDIIPVSWLHPRAYMDTIMAPCFYSTSCIRLSPYLPCLVRGVLRRCAARSCETELLVDVKLPSKRVAGCGKSDAKKCQQTLLMLSAITFAYPMTTPAQMIISTASTSDKCLIKYLAGSTPWESS